MIVGLGNPGNEYDDTRHNIGRDVVEAFRSEFDFPEWEFSKNANALYSKKKIGRHVVELLLPETFMNNSGKAVAYAKVKHKIKPENIIVVHDDIDLPLGVLRVSVDRGTAGHKGLESIKRHIGTLGFARLRFGILAKNKDGKIIKPRGEQKVIDFVLKKFADNEREVVDNEIARGVKAVEVLIKKGAQFTMNKFN